MKKILLSLVFVYACLFVDAQDVVYFSEKPSAMLYTLPRTSLTAKFLIEKQSIKTGVYARFAQKYLGVVAPLTDKDVYSIKKVDLEGFVESDPNHIYAVDASKEVLNSLLQKTGSLPMPISQSELGDKFSVDNAVVMTEFSEVVKSISNTAIDKTSSDAKTLEQMAAQAAKTIFMLRQRKYDLITGEAGENVFGAGLAAAIDEINRLESEYLALFVGSEAVSQEIKQLDIMPIEDKQTYIICRFSADKGLTSIVDLSGEPVVLEINADKLNPIVDLPRKPVEVGKKEVIVQDLYKYRVAEIATCRVLLGLSELYTERIPIYQFGAIVDIPVNVEIITIK